MKMIFALLLLMLTAASQWGCASIQKGPATSEPAWFIQSGRAGDDILYCYPPHYKSSKYAGKCFDLN